MRMFALGVFLLCILVQAQLNTPTLLLPIETTQGIRTEYSIGFNTDTAVPHSAKVRVTFPFEFNPSKLITHNGCRMKKANATIVDVPCTLSNRSFIIDTGTI